ncbi:flagellar basal-body MS-ring/collar protein FliF [Sansalvadorimonas verongulae]|uniref:flagellar basal-body MS-ring/collar protein FliF n=1 Tax=Sansalvadorimonas verongulae TaxID=2172824 RepID=UPI0012BCCA94|nr:flagellar basal-body MS-ring/collar protein FliF [Sansalvadorimonas verongulae]MTI13481.1 flagellar M-ring protein FliF [Sansalvadorimonas verongulae]
MNSALAPETQAPAQSPQPDGEQTTPATEQEQSRGKQLLMALVTMLHNSPRSQLMLIVVLAGSLAMGIVSFLWSQSTAYQPLYGSQELYDVSSVTGVLKQENIKFRIHPQSGQVMVDSSRISEARIKLASAGITQEQPEGLDSLGEDPSLGTSQFMENVRYRQGQAGELARTIISLKPVRNARVHLAIPKKSSFVRKTEKPTASVFVELLPGHRLDRSQVEAIVNLIASSVTGLPRENISVIDQKGNLLSRDLTVDDGGFGMANKQLEYSRKVEANYTNRISNLLEPIVGIDNYRVQVTADVDFNRIEQTSEQFDPSNRRVIRSEYGRETGNNSEATAGVPGALSNIPPQTGADSEASETVQGQKEYTRNYELDRVIKKVTQQQGRVKRLSIAVILNQSSFEEGTAPDTAQLKQLVQDAVGFDSERQDQISIHSAGFVKPEVTEIPEIPWWQQPQIITYLRYGIGGFLSFCVIVFLLRPLVNRVANPPPLIQAPQSLAAPQASQDDMYLDESMALLPPEVADFDTQMSSARKLAQKEPARVAQVAKMWMKNNE